MANKQSFTCDICKTDLSTKYSLIRHLEHQHDDNMEWLDCNHCTHKSKRSYDLQMHIKAKHPQEWTKIIAAKPKGRGRKRSRAAIYDTEKGRQLTADTIVAALKKPTKPSKVKLVSYSSSEDEDSVTEIQDPKIQLGKLPVLIIRNTSTGPVLSIPEKRDIVSIHPKSPVTYLVSDDDTPTQDEHYYQPVTEPISPVTTEED